MLGESWIPRLLLSFVAVVLVHAALASLTTLYYSKASWGRLTHSQLRIKQQNATYEHRLNVFAQTVLFSFVNFKVYLATMVVWLLISVIDRFL